MSVTEHERALAVLDDDGWGAAITTELPAYHEHWRPGQQLVKHRHAAGHAPHEHAAAAPEPAPWAWPAGKTFGELSPADRAIASRRAASQLQDELRRAAPAIAAIMEQEGE